MSEWITDRLPTERDASPSGRVWVFVGESLMDVDYVDWSIVLDDTPWQPIPKPAPYVKPKRWTVGRYDHSGSWYIHNDEQDGDRLDGRLTQDAVQRICDIYNEELP